MDFNSDGSIRLPGRIAQAKQDNERKLRSNRCIKLKREIVSFSSPKKCILKLMISDVISDTRFIENIFNEFKCGASVPIKLKKIDDKNFEVEVGTDFRRCSDCNKLIGLYNEFLDGNIIDDKGGCTFEGRSQSFCYEDYFE